MSLKETSAKFWQRAMYPKYNGTIRRRRFFELRTLAPMLDNVATLIDVGCGDGALIRCLRETTDVGEFVGCDFSPMLPDGAGFFEWDAYDPEPLPPADFATCCGVAPYLTDEALGNMLLMIDSPKLFLRAPCATGTRLEIDKFSEQLDAQYASIYRTADELRHRLESAGWTSTPGRRIYPDNLESEFPTKQYFFVCQK